MELLDTHAEVLRTTLKELGVDELHARTDYRFWCDVRVDGQTVRMEREVSTPRSFYEPWEVAGLTIFFDAVEDIFGFLNETHGACRPSRQARFAVQDASLRICPEPVHAWCPLPENGLRIEDCFRGENCWLGAFNGAAAHGGLDINHPARTPLWAPFDIDDHFFFNRVDTGHNNNRWRGLRRWANGAEWILEACHLPELIVPERQPIRGGEHYAWGAGIHRGKKHITHSHFTFKVHDDGETIPLDPWILFRQMYLDQPD